MLLDNLASKHNCPPEKLLYSILLQKFLGGFHKPWMTRTALVHFLPSSCLPSYKERHLHWLPTLICLPLLGVPSSLFIWVLPSTCFLFPLWMQTLQCYCLLPINLKNVQHIFFQKRSLPLKSAFRHPLFHFTVNFFKEETLGFSFPHPLVTFQKNVIWIVII